MNTKHGRPLTTYPLYSVRQVTCDELVKIISGDRVTMGCPTCCLFFYEDEVSGERKCPKCDSTETFAMTEDTLADGIVPETCYRVCDQCQFCFFWNDEVAYRDSAGRMVSSEDGQPLGDHEEGSVMYTCPSCGRPTT